MEQLCSSPIQSQSSPPPPSTKKESTRAAQLVHVCVHVCSCYILSIKILAKRGPLREVRTPQSQNSKDVCTCPQIGTVITDFLTLMLLFTHVHPPGRRLKGRNWREVAERREYGHVNTVAASRQASHPCGTAGRGLAFFQVTCQPLVI